MNHYTRWLELKEDNPEKYARDIAGLMHISEAELAFARVGHDAWRLRGEIREILGALEAVDWVVSFEEDTPQRLIAGILPDLLVKGGDYKPEQIAGSEEVWANGGEVMVLNFEDGCSTTNIIKKIQKDSQ